MLSATELNLEADSFKLTHISFEIPTGKIGVLMGKTGCGKTTLLEGVCGLKTVRSGKLVLMGRDVTHFRPSMRGVGFVPQDGALFSTMTVAEHLSFALDIRKWTQDKIKARVEELANLLGIASLLKRKPKGLSGGEIKRVALGRALSFKPDILCMDEPFSALDEEVRVAMCQLVKSVQQHTGVTTLHITHNPTEAKMLADVLFELKDGVLNEKAISTLP